MRLEYQIIVAMVLDALAGDPAWLPHPVKLIGLLSARLEKILRRVIDSEYIAGALTAATVVISAGAAAWLLVAIAGAFHHWAADAIAVLLLYTTFAARDLAHHGLDVLRPLETGDIFKARRKAGRMVGRDTDLLGRQSIVRAAVESIAENTVDGVTAPLLFAIAGGPVAAIAYKAINTLDSTFGYKTEQYLKFGWASAKLDDLANYIPARISALSMTLAAAVLRMQPAKAFFILRRDGRKHLSPNAGLCEAVMAGALGVRLGGLSRYFGEPSEKPFIGDPDEFLRPVHIQGALYLMLTTYGIIAVVFIGGRMLINTFIGK